MGMGKAGEAARKRLPGGVIQRYRVKLNKGVRYEGLGKECS